MKGKHQVKNSEDNSEVKANQGGEWQSTPTPVQALRRSDTAETLSDSGSDVMQALQRLRSFDRNGDLAELAQSLEAKFIELATPTKEAAPSVSTATPGCSPGPGSSQPSPTEVLDEASGLNGQGQNSAQAGTGVPKPKLVVTPESKPNVVETPAVTTAQKVSEGPEKKPVVTPESEPNVVQAPAVATGNHKVSEGPEPKAVVTPESNSDAVETPAAATGNQKVSEGKAAEAPKPKPTIVETSATEANNTATEDPKEKATQASEKEADKKDEDKKDEAEAKQGEDNKGPDAEALTEKEAKKAEELQKRKKAAHARYMRYYRSVRGRGLS
ncbi:hypothetical protein AK812_SmicGene838 [Symbiodinium microadriaticum]|uniref:Uncharacterized protein n=1 Tax=Symbiodinium microadriaticum TaxID=2951 RepID=A0A1Q9F5M9_SYMMI|nr:hypothetical protein AK812_SmicGene838 [Symbiodinium microadriaticum]